MAKGAPQDRKTRFYLLENYYLRHGAQLARIHDFLSAVAGPKIVLEALVAPHMPQVMAVIALESIDEWQSLKLKRAEAPYEHYSQTLLRATGYSPEIAATSSKTSAPRAFELRQYHSPTWRQLAALHQRFAGPEIKIFHRVGVHPMLYGETVLGVNMPNLTYLTPFDNLTAREKAWDTFGADPEWIKVRKESVDAHGQIASVIQISLWRPAPYSPVR